MASRDIILSQLRADVREIVRLGMNDKWPNEAVAADLVAQFSPSTKRIGSLSTQATGMVIQPFGLSEYYKNMAILNGGEHIPRAQYCAAAALRTARRIFLLHERGGDHLITPTVISKLPEQCRKSTLQYWMDINKSGSSASVRLLDDVDASVADGTSLHVYWGDRGPAGASESRTELVALEDGERALERPEAGTELFYPAGSEEALARHEAFRMMAGAALSAAETNGYLARELACA